MICISRRFSRKFFASSSSILVPPSVISPSLDVSLRSALPSVVFPEPDSPAIPSVSPFLSEMFTPSTAFTCPIVLLSTPRSVLNWVPRFIIVDQKGGIAKYYAISPTDPEMQKTIDQLKNNSL